MITRNINSSFTSIHIAVFVCFGLPFVITGCSKTDQPVQGSTKSETPKPVDGIMQHSEEKNDK